MPIAPPKTVQTHDDITEIPEGVELPNSELSHIEDEEPTEDVDYSDVDLSEADL